mgnify:CR=1 FL=1|tara:strand:- start:39 stop:473 length:435 start_codon:yes stop_codon:yes gene_type:complete
MSKTRIKDTKLGEFLKKKAPSILGIVGDMLPERGTLGVVKRLLGNEPGVSAEEAAAIVEAEIAFQDNVTKRWQADMGSDVKLAKLIRPLTLVALMCIFTVTMILDSIDNYAFNVKDSYVDLLQILMLTAFGAYFAGRTIEKTKN